MVSISTGCSVSWFVQCDCVFSVQRDSVFSNFAFLLIRLLSIDGYRVSVGNLAVLTKASIG